MIGYRIVAAAVLFALPQLVGQQPEDGDGDTGTSIGTSRRAVWEAVLPGGTYLVDLASVTMVAWHDYRVDGTLDVSEVTIDTGGATSTRFYHVRPAGADSPVGVGESLLDTLEKRAAQVARRAGQGDLLDTLVIKSYPATTHSKTVEYRVGDDARLQALYNHLRRHWLEGRSGTFMGKEQGER